MGHFLRSLLRALQRSGRALAVAMALMNLAPAHAAGALVLTDAQGMADAWPAVRVLHEGAQPYTHEQAAERLPQFQPPAGPHANLGVQRHGVWLHLPLQVQAGGDSRWLLDVDYATLDRIELYHRASPGPGQAQAAWQALGELGDFVPFAQRPLRARSHAIELRLEPGRTHELLMRVASTSTLVLPLRLYKAQALAEREADIVLAQGLAAGLAACLVLYALFYGLSLRDAAFFWYALMVGTLGLFFFSFHGLAAQHLWGGHEWLTRYVPAWTSFPVVAAALMFVSHALRVSEAWPRYARLLRAMAWGCGVFTLAYPFGVIDHRIVQLLGALISPLPMVLGIPVAWLRARQGEASARWLLLGWSQYIVGVVAFVAMLRGAVGYNAFSLYALQVCFLLEAFTWLRVLGLRAEQYRSLAERANHERETMRLLALTDALTGLPNRRCLAIELEAALANATPQRPVAVLMLDLDGFKAVNDSLGHEAGDALLVEAARRLSEAVRPGDVVARLGGDEFVVVACDLHEADDGGRIARKLIQRMAEPFEIESHRCQVGLTVGCALAPLHDRSARRLLHKADAALYEGKRAGKGQVVVHSGG